MGEVGRGAAWARRHRADPTAISPPQTNVGEPSARPARVHGLRRIEHPAWRLCRCSRRSSSQVDRAARTRMCTQTARGTATQRPLLASLTVPKTLLGPQAAFGRASMTEQWMCLFLNRSGMKAHAVFATQAQARQFAEKHAQASAPGMPLTWNDPNNPILLTTSVGTYWIVRNSKD
jgi:hypothetical protein